MTDLYVYLGSFFASALMMLICWLIVSRSVAAENAIQFEEWERI